jgi:cytochrome P450
MYVGDPQAASQYVTTGQSLPKAPLAKAYLEKFLGKNNLVTLEGERWKSRRAIFNPGFSPANIMSLTDFIVDATLQYTEILRAKAETGEHFQLEECLTRLTIEIIARVVLDVEIPAQRVTHPITQLFRERVKLMPPTTAVLPWQNMSLTRPFLRWRNGRALDAAITVELHKKILQRAAEQDAEEAAEAAAVAAGEKYRAPARKRSVVDLALSAYEKEETESQQSSSSEKKTITTTTNKPVRVRTPADLPPRLTSDMVDAVKTFVFAGHDTTASTLAWATYLLHRHPAVHARLRAELDAHLPAAGAGGPAEAAAAIRADPYLLNRLEYTTAVLRETMRLFPPASTVRDVVPGGVVVNARTNEKIPMLPGAQIVS